MQSSLMSTVHSKRLVGHNTHSIGIKSCLQFSFEYKFAQLQTTNQLTILVGAVHSLHNDLTLASWLQISSRSWTKQKSTPKYWFFSNENRLRLRTFGHSFATMRILPCRRTMGGLLTVSGNSAVVQLARSYKDTRHFQDLHPIYVTSHFPHVTHSRSPLVSEPLTLVCMSGRSIPVGSRLN